jgi:hypothetical protein
MKMHGQRRFLTATMRGVARAVMLVALSGLCMTGYYAAAQKPETGKPPAPVVEAAPVIETVPLPLPPAPHYSGKPVPDDGGTAAAAPAIPPNAVAADADIAAALERVRADGDIQTRFSEPPPLPERHIEPPSGPNWLSDFFGWLMGGGQGIMRVLAGILIAGVLLLVLYLTVPVVREWIDGLLRRKPKGEEDMDADNDSWRPDTSGARNLLAEADALAVAGRYAEAVHLLLGRSLEDIGTRRPGLLKPALTARAIATMDDLPAPARSAFAQIADAVERSLWAGRDIDASDWQVARAGYEAFAFGDHWRSARAQRDKTIAGTGPTLAMAT